MNKSIKRKWLESILCFMLLFALTACGQTPPATPGEVDSPSKISTVSNTSLPANTNTPIPTPTNTPEPTPTNAPSATPTLQVQQILSDYMNGIKIIRYEAFNSTDYEVELSQNAQISDDQIMLNGRGYSGGIELRKKFDSQNGVMFDFMIQPDDVDPKFEFETYFDIGTWWTPEYRRFGVYLVGAPEANMWKGTQGSGKRLTGNLNIIPGEKYTCALAIGDNGEFFALIWDPNKPGDIRKYRLMLGGAWEMKNWKFVINGASGKMSIDNIGSFSFDSYK